MIVICHVQIFLFFIFANIQITTGMIRGRVGISLIAVTFVLQVINRAIARDENRTDALIVIGIREKFLPYFQVFFALSHCLVHISGRAKPMARVYLMLDEAGWRQITLKMTVGRCT